MNLSSNDKRPRRSRFRRRSFAALFAAAAIGGLPAPASAQDAGIIADACTGCHGVGGRSDTAIPTIAGIDPVIFIQLMNGFRNDTIAVTIMNRIAKAYDDEQIEMLAAYFAAR